MKFFSVNFLCSILYNMKITNMTLVFTKYLHVSGKEEDRGKKDEN